METTSDECDRYITQKIPFSENSYLGIWSIRDNVFKRLFRTKKRDFFDVYATRLLLCVAKMENC